MTSKSIEGNEAFKRVVWILNSNRWGSAITEYTLQMAKALSNRFEVIYTPLRSTPADKKAIELGLNVFPVEKFDGANLHFLKALKNKYSPAFIITAGGPDTYLISKLKKRKYETRIRFRGDHLKQGMIRSFGFRLSHKSYDAFITPCDLISEQLKKKTNKKIKSIMLGVDAERFKISAFDTLSEHKRRIIIFGRLDPVKGHKEFISIFANYKKKYPDSPTELIIAGREENISKDELYACAEQYGVETSVSFNMGTIEDVPKLLSSADIGVISSLGSEIICRVAHEFLLCGSRVLVSGAGATDEVLKDSSFGNSYKSCTSDQTVQLLKDMLEEPQDKLAKEQRSLKARDFFSLESMALGLESYLEDLSIFGA